MPTSPRAFRTRRSLWHRRSVRLGLGLLITALGMGLAFDAGRQSVRSTAAPSLPLVATATQHPAGVADGSAPATAAVQVDLLRQSAPPMHGVPLGRRLPTENACGACHRIADPEIHARAQPML